MLFATSCGEKLAPAAPAADSQAIPPDLADLARPAAPNAPEATPTGGADPEEAGPAGSFAANGELRSPMESPVTVRVAGRVAAVLADEGELVRRGAPLLRLETEYAELDVARARADVARSEAVLAEAERELGRKEQLFSRGSVAPATRDKAATAREQAAASLAWSWAALATAERRLADATLTAPFTGVVVSRQAAVGAFVDDRTGAFVLAQTDPLRLRFDLPERLFARVRKGQTVHTTLDAYPGETFTGTVSVIGQTVDPANRAVFVEAELANGDGRLKPGMFARVEISFE
jgi:membrane fusion protein (multidrug efflux system)